MSDALTSFHPLVAQWFRTHVGTPTDVQARAWPTIARGRHVLATAPTGSGKTLTAFLWSLNHWPPARGNPARPACSTSRPSRP